MKRILLLLLAFAAVAFAGWYYWNFFQRISSAPVSTLLPRETIFLVYIPDFNRTRDEWYRSDIYQLYREAAVQDFLRPGLAGLGKLPKTPTAAQTLREIEQRNSRKTQLTEWRSPTGPRTMQYSFTCSQKRFLSGLRLCAPLFDPARLPASPRCSRKCAASRVRCGSTTAKYTTCFFSGCRSWSVQPPSPGRRYRWEQKKPFFIYRCF